MSKKRILITGAGSGFGEGAAIGLAQNGHDVIAGAQIWPQVTSLRVSDRCNRVAVGCGDRLRTLFSRELLRIPIFSGGVLASNKFCGQRPIRNE
jgi:hypothetical protein